MCGGRKGQVCARVLPVESITHCDFGVLDDSPADLGHDPPRVHLLQQRRDTPVLASCIEVESISLGSSTVLTCSTPEEPTHTAPGMTSRANRIGGAECNATGVMQSEAQAYRRRAIDYSIQALRSQRERRSPLDRSRSNSQILMRR